MAVTYIGGDANGGNVDNLTGVTWPTHQNGDYAFIVMTNQDTSTPTTPTGFTQLDTDQDGNVESTLYYKVCDGSSESGDVSLAWSTINRVTATLAVYRGATGTPTVASAAEGSTDTTHACPSVSFTGSHVILTHVSERTASGGTTSGTAPTGHTKRVEFGTSGSGGTWTAWSDNLTATSTSPQTPDDWTGTASASSVVTRTIALQVAGGAINTNAGQASETDSGQAHGRSKRAGSGLSSAANTGQVVGRRKSAGVGQAL